VPRHERLLEKPRAVKFEREMEGLNFILGAIAGMKFYPCCGRGDKISSALRNKNKEGKWAVKFMHTTRTAIKERCE